MTLASILEAHLSQPLYWVIDVYWFFDTIPLLRKLLILLGEERPSSSDLEADTLARQQEMKHTAKLLQDLALLKAENTRHRHAIATLQKSEKLYQALFEHVNEGIFTLGADGTLTSINQSAAQMLGRSCEKMLGHPCQHLLTPSSGEEVAGLLRPSQEGAVSASNLDIEMIHADGTIIPTEVWARSLLDNAGQLSGFVWIFRRMTKQEKLHKRLKQAPKLSVQSVPGSSGQETLNLTEALARVGGDRELLREMAGFFLEEYPQALSSIHTALSQNDSETLLYSAHALRSSAGNFAAAGTVQAALKLENIARQGDLSQASPVIVELEQELLRLQSSLSALTALRA